MAGNLPFNKERFETDKKVADEGLVTLLAGDLWKKEEKEKKKKPEEK